MSDAQFPHSLGEKIKAAKGWDSAMRELMLASKALPVLPLEQRTDENKVSGCQSQVWLLFDEQQTRFLAWSDAKIIRGVLAVLLEKANGHSIRLDESAYVGYMHELGLHRYLSESRANGITAVIRRLCFAGDF